MLDVPSTETLTGIWAFHPDDTEIVRYFDSMTNMLEVCASAIETGVLVWHERAGFIPADPDEPTFDTVRRAGTVESVVYPRHIPEGARISRFAEPTWPKAWLISLGLADGVAPLRGASHTIAELVAASAYSEVSGTVVGTISRLMVSSESTAFDLTDGTGILEVVERGSVFLPTNDNVVEVDVTIEKGARPSDLSGWTEEDLRLVNPSGGTPAKTSAVRPIPQLD